MEKVNAAIGISNTEDNEIVSEIETEVLKEKSSVLVEENEQVKETNEKIKDINDQVEEQLKKKRGRGRPPKAKNSPTKSQEQPVISSETIVISDGRPKRQVIPKVNSNYVYTSSAGPSSSSPVKEDAPKTKGGVKRKIKNETDEIVYEIHELPVMEGIELDNNEQVVQVKIIQDNNQSEREIIINENVELIEGQEEQPMTAEPSTEKGEFTTVSEEFPDGYLPTEKRKDSKKVYMKDPDDPLRRFHCPYAGCTYVAKYRSNLWDHKKTHTGEKPYQCTWPDCSMRFSQTHQLKLHTRSHTGERPYKCEWPGCDAAFSQKPGLRSHSLTHTGEKKFACDYPGCTWSFRLKGALTDHKRAIHEDRKLHKCEWPGCDKRFLQNCHLKKHLMAHADIKPFACDWPKCSYKAVTMAYVTNHRRTHTGERNHECTFPGCNKKFVKSSHVNRHRQRCHPQGYVTNDGEYVEQDVFIEDDEGEFQMEQEIPQENIQNDTEDNENVAENEQIVIEYSETENEIIIQTGNSQKIYKGQLVEDKEGRQYILSEGGMIPLQDIINDDNLKEENVQEVYLKEEAVEEVETQEA